ncbi:MAG: hypothetical protein AABY22_24635 [Nanoarchaeota archaeon]
MDISSQNELFKEALKEIAEKAEDHFMYLGKEMEEGPIQNIVDVGGDSCDWTLIARYAHRALSLKDIYGE